MRVVAADLTFRAVGWTRARLDAASRLRRFEGPGTRTPEPMPDLAPLLALRQRPIAFLLHYVVRHKLGHALLVSAVLGAVICAVMTQYGLKSLVDIVAAGPGTAVASGLGTVWSAFLLLCALIAADNLLWRVAGFVAARVFVAVSGDVRRDLFAHLSGHAPAYYADRLPGALASRITATANATFTTEQAVLWNVLPPCVAVLMAIGLIGTVNPLMALALGAISLALAVLIYRMAAAGAPLHRRYADSAAAVDGELVDVIGNIGVVRAFGASLRERHRLGERIGAEMQARRASLYYLERLRLTHAVVTAVLTAALIGWALMMWERGQVSAGDIVLITSLGFTILHSTRDLAVALVELTQHVARLEEAIDTLLLPHGLPDAPSAQRLLPGRAPAPGRIDFKNVSFAYPGRTAAIEGFDLTIEPGQKVGLVGASGAGKSTVLSLLQRFYDPAGGQVLIDGQDIAKVTHASLLDMLAIVPQDTALFHRTVLENIRYARPDATEAEVLAAADAAQCRAFIEALPDGFSTIVGDRGAKLSGGQRQRLAIARALLKDAPILLLDEATSALDSESERLVQAALGRLMAGRTVIAIAHRLATLEQFDRIVVMDRGRIVDDGSPAALAARPGPYRDLLRRQTPGGIGAAAFGTSSVPHLELLPEAA